MEQSTPVLFVRDPKFGWDPWLGPETPAPELAASQIFLGADGFEIGILPSGLSVYMSYVDNFGGWPALVSRFGRTNAKLVSITIFGNPAQCADVEPGAMSPSDLPHWLDHVALRPGGHVPWVYTSAGNFAEVNNFIGGRKVVRWSAHYGQGPHICGPGTCGFPQADWTQWAETGPGGQNYDRSIGRVLPGPPKPADPQHYAWFSGMVIIRNQRIFERNTVEEYDRRRVHPIANAHRLRVLKYRLSVLSHKVWTVAHEQPNKDGRPSWQLFHRGWRYQELTHRAEGRRLV